MHRIPQATRHALLALVLCIPFDAGAIPAFSRQINADCRTCHFQDMHALNAYGRAFKLNAFKESKEMRRKRLQQAEEQHHEAGPKRKKP
jgi:hypothetical protein